MSDTNPDEQTIQKFKRLLKNNGYPLWLYSFDGYSDDRVCLENSDNHWLVYTGERGNKGCVSQYYNLKDAFLKMVSLTSGTKEAVKKLSEQIDNYCFQTKEAEERMSISEHQKSSLSNTTSESESVISEETPTDAKKNEEDETSPPFADTKLDKVNQTQKSTTRTNELKPPNKRSKTHVQTRRQISQISGKASTKLIQPNNSTMPKAVAISGKASTKLIQPNNLTMPKAAAFRFSEDNRKRKRKRGNKS